MPKQEPTRDKPAHFERQSLTFSWADLLFQEHDSPTGLDGADLSVLVHGNHEETVHHPFLPLTGVHQQVGAVGQTRSFTSGSYWVHAFLNPHPYVQR